ncbi:MAG: diguanylate cyclase [Colwellia sp.]|nr:diguanylate cyclase [Colwellia sp.]MCW8865956.1 diguanylate cyclase [Colwellia sp.]MCW9082353.1 diguanylate cyclase [Colwellia sp.]
MIIGTSSVTSAAALNDVSALENLHHELNQHPWQTYQDLQTQAEQFEEMSLEYKLWWLNRKAQAENLLFLFEQFQQTVAKAQDLITPDTPAKLTSQFYIYSGIIFQRQGKYQNAQKLLKMAKSVAESNNFTYIAVQAKQELAYTRSLTEFYELSLTELQQAYVEAFAFSDDYLIAKIHEVYGAIYGYMHDYEKSIEYYKKSLISYQQLGYPSDIAEAINGLAATYRYWKKFDLAIDYYQRYEKAIEFSPHNVDGKFYAAYGIAMSQAEKGDCHQALKSIDKALNLKGLIDYKAEIYKRKAQCLITFNKLLDAEVALDKAQSIFANIPELIGTHWQIEVIKIRAELAQVSGDSNQAYQLLKEYNQVQTALIKKNSSDKLLRVRGKLEHERQNVEISLLQQRAEVQKLQYEQQKQKNNFQTYLITFSVLFALMVLVFVFFQRRHNKKLLALSIRDPLSELYNRRYVFSFLNKLVSAIDTEKSQVSIMVIDIDNFKQVNDHCGHPFGDYVIREIAKIGQETLRAEDIMGRVGGEEFLCVLPRIDAEQCMHIANRFVKNVNSHNFKIEHKANEQQVANITISIGIATTSLEVEDYTQLYAMADKALYHAKKNGRNCVVKYSSEMTESNQSYFGLSHPIHEDS